MRKTINIKGEIYKIRRKKNLRLKSVGAANGVIDYVRKIIWIDSALKGREFIHTLLHEVFHGGNAALHLNEDGGIDPAIEEVQNSGFASILLENFDIKLKKAGR